MGTEVAWLLSLVGATGAQGQQGNVGATGPSGPTGATGRGIASVVRTSGTGAPGTTDTYTITYSDATASTFSVYNGANGAGVGDMLASAYDTNADGKVNAADAADAVPWAGVTGKPATFAPSTHAHAITEVTGLQVALDGKQASGSYVLTGDTRLSDARPPTGGAGGVLSGTYPNPGFAVDMATKAELDAVATAKADAAHAHTAANISDSTAVGRAVLTAVDAEAARAAIGAGTSSTTGTVTDVTGTDPITSTGGTAPVIGITAATTSAAGSMSAADKTKLDGVASGATNYTHPANHPPSIITQDASNRFVTDTEKATWNAKQPAGTYATGTGTATGTNTGDQTITLTGGVTGSGTGSFAATVVTNANLTGEVTSVGNATTVTNAAVIGKVLTGYVSGAGTVADTDTILQAINKLNGNDGLRAPLASPTFTGTPAAPTAAVGTNTTQIATTEHVFAERTATATLTNKTLITPVLGTPASGNLSNTTADGTNPVGFRHIPQVSQSAAYTLVLTDAGKHILHPSADTTARTFTIPANSAVAFPIGTAITFINQASAGVLTIAITTDVMRLAGAGTTGSRTLAANGVATAIKLTATEWIINGAGLT